MEAAERESGPAVRTDVAYAPPKTPSLSPRWQEKARLAQRLLGGALAAPFLGVLLANITYGMSSFLFLVSPLLFLLGVSTAVSARREFTKTASTGSLWSWFSMVSMSLLWVVGASGVMYLATHFRRGRQLHSRGEVLLAPVTDGKDWARLNISTEVHFSVRRALAAQWRENGRTEHASVAAFGKLTMDLMALGAPPRLLSDANEDALDEIRHAELCFSIARSLDGKAQSPGAFSAVRKATPLPTERNAALAALAVDSMVEGLLLEGVSARVVARLMPRCEEPAIRSVLKEIAADEGRHAAHSWHVVEWCIEEGGTSIVRALEAAAARLPDTMSSDAPPEARAGAWEKYGIPSAALEAEEYAKAKADVVKRVRALTATRLAA